MQQSTNSSIFYLLTALIHCLAITITSGERILFLLPIATKSHKNVFVPLFTAMADKGHEVTVVSPGYQPTPHKNIRELVPITYEDIVLTQGKGGYKNPLDRRSSGKAKNMISTAHFNYAVLACELIYQKPEFLQLLEERFDLVLINGFLNNCFQGMIYKLGAPFIIVTTMASPSITSYAVGNHLPPSFIPFCISDLTDEMNFFQRTKNLIYEIYFQHLFAQIYIPFEETYRKHLGADLPDLTTLEKNVSLILSNSHFALTYPRPLLPDIVEVGGMHCRPVKPLPTDLEDFLSGADQGFVYFSLGSVMNTDQMPEDIRLKFLNVFSRLKQRVIWKWNSGHMDDLPENVRVSKWLPQQDILGHKNIRVFITHGGLLSTQEAAYHGVPLIGIPIFADQDLNVIQAVRKGYALRLEILEFTETGLEELLNEILKKPSYASKAKKLSLIVKDELQTPLERAIYWSEYVIRHNGARHLRSGARDLNFIQYHSLDVILFVGLIFSSVLFIIVAFCKCCLKKCARSK